MGPIPVCRASFVSRSMGGGGGGGLEVGWGGWEWGGVSFLGINQPERDDDSV